LIGNRHFPALGSLVRRKKKSPKNKRFYPSLALSPLRYPGGKSWLIPKVEKWLHHLKTDRRHQFVEPFAGGANVGLTMLARQKVGRLLIAELDKRIAAFWKVTLQDPDWLIRAIRGFRPTRKNLAIHLTLKPRGFRRLGFQTLLKNRTSRGGVIAPRAGILQRGERDKGPFSRWYPETLIKRIEQIRRYRAQITLVQGDGVRLLRSRRHRSNDVYFIDPPYSHSLNGAGRRLYSHYEIPHDALFGLTKKLKGRFLMTYDDNKAMEVLAKKHGLSTSKTRMKSSHHAAKKELLISTDLTSIKNNSLSNEAKAKSGRNSRRRG
jgi:DNA adenine methylase